MRRLLALAAAALLLMTASGCAALFDRELYTLEPYESQGAVQEPEEDAADSISSYAGLRRAIARLVSEHADSGELQFQNYEGSISRDISTACWEVKSSTALGAYAVDYISYDLSRIVSYYQAEINITYKKSAWQLSALEQTENMASLRTRLGEAVRAGETYLALRLTAASLTAEDARAAVEEAYYADPLGCPVLPAVEAVVYPESGVERIIETTLDYGMDGRSLEKRREELAEAAAEMIAAVRAAEPEASASGDGAPRLSGKAALLERLCRYLTENCAYDKNGGGTAWDALCAGTADSEGLAMALEAGCRMLGIDCRVVLGRLDADAHAWDMATLGDGVYHVDVSNRDGNGGIVFLASDAEMWGSYWWDISEYPPSPAGYRATEEPTGQGVSGEPSAGPDPANTPGPGREQRS